MRLPPISLATESDLPALSRLTAACIAEMRAEGIEQWDEVYPAESDLRRDILAQALWVLRQAGEIVGCMTLDATQDPLWSDIPWQYTSEPIGAVHRLMIDPDHQGRGLARRFMEFAEAQASRDGRSTLRLDAFVQNLGAISLYENLGYRKSGTATMRKGVFAGFEKPLLLPAVTRPFPQPRDFTGRHVSLTPLRLDGEIDDLFAVSHASAAARELWRYLPCGPFTEASQLRAFYQQWTSKPDLLAVTAWQNEPRQRVGSLSIMNIRPEPGVAELGMIWYEPGTQRTKINTEANYLLLRYCFEELGYRRMEWKCDAANERSQRAAMRLGYRYEGTFRQHLIVKGRNRDTAWFSIVDHEWPRQRAALERSLYATDSARW